jgi:16S rRNA C967 or C1407 C5-methylase (RsmB/RsmF family)
LSELFPSVIITNHDAQIYPNLKDSNNNNIKFDRILCDVMCSGDGTLRKSPDLWGKWKPNFAYALHSIQVKITLRAIKLLKKNGRIVYSTCSMNPIEDEASISEILRQSKGNL